MHLRTPDVMENNKLSPFPVSRVALRKKDHPLLDSADLALGFRCRQSETVARSRPSHHIPELRDVLVRVTKCRTPTGKRRYGLVGHRAFGIRAARNAQQDICIYKAGVGS